MTKLRFEYDPDKSALNRQRHGIDFGKAQRLWGGTHFIFPARTVGGEDRQIALGTIDEKIYMAVFVKRGETIRLITCHRANNKRERIYERYLEEKGP